MKVGELLGGAARHRRLFAAGIDEQQILLAVVIETKLRCGSPRLAATPPVGLDGQAAAMEPGPCGSKGAGRSMIVEPWSWAGCEDIKPWMRSRVSVVMRPPLRSRAASLPSFTARRPKVELGEAGLPAIIGYFPGQQLLGVHGNASRPLSPRSRAPLSWRSVSLYLKRTKAWAKRQPQSGPHIQWAI